MQTPPVPRPLSLTAIRTDGNTQLRERLDARTVLEYAEAMQGNAPFPPIIVFYDGENYWLADGFHRVEAARQASLAQIAAEVRSGTRRDAVLYAAGANATHGLRRTTADKRRCVLALLRDPEWGLWSDREIARRTGVDNKTVAALRRTGSEEIPRMERRARRGDTVYLMKTPARSVPATAPEQLGAGAAVAVEPQNSGEVLSDVPVLASPEGPSSAGDLAGALGVAAWLREALQRVPAAPPLVRQGEWWQLGPHRLFCGEPGHPAFLGRLPQAPLALLSPGVAAKAGATWPERAALILVPVENEQLAELLRATALPYRGLLVAPVERGPVGRRQGAPGWLPVLLFGRTGGAVALPDLPPLPLPQSTAPAAHAGAPVELCLPLLEQFVPAGGTVLTAGDVAETVLLAAEATGRVGLAALEDPDACGRLIRRWEQVAEAQGQRDAQARVCLPGRW